MMSSRKRAVLVAVLVVSGAAFVAAAGQGASPDNPWQEWKTLRFKVWTMGRYGRPIVTAYDGGRDLHLELLEQGWAVAYRQYLPDPLKSAYLAAEAGAKAAKRGLWQGKFIVPSAWRRGGRLACERR